MKPLGKRWTSDVRKRLPCLLAGGLFALLVLGTLRDSNFWLTSDQHGDALFRAKKYKEAAKAYVDPIRIGAAQYREGDFEAAAKTFARVPGAIGAFDEGNALLFHGNYDGAIAAYQRAISVQPGWQPAEGGKQEIYTRPGSRRTGTDEDLQVTWLRRVQTTPGDFLKAKFAYQAGLAKNGGAK
jgi:Ca-activated chloride channel homolog